MREVCTYLINITSSKRYWDVFVFPELICDDYFWRMWAGWCYRSRKNISLGFSPNPYKEFASEIRQHGVQEYKILGMIINWGTAHYHLSVLDRLLKRSAVYRFLSVYPQIIITTSKSWKGLSPIKPSRWISQDSCKSCSETSCFQTLALLARTRGSRILSALSANRAFAHYCSL